MFVTIKKKQSIFQLLLFLKCIYWVYLAIEEYPISLPRGYFCSLLFVIVHLHCEVLPDQFHSIWHITVHPAAAISHHNNDLVLLAGLQAPTLTLLSPCLMDHVHASVFLHTFLFPSVWYKFILVPSVQNYFFFRCFLTESGLPVPEYSQWFAPSCKP